MISRKGFFVISQMFSLFLIGFTAEHAWPVSARAIVFGGILSLRNRQVREDFPPRIDAPATWLLPLSSIIAKERELVAHRTSQLSCRCSNHLYEERPRFWTAKLFANQKKPLLLSLTPCSTAESGTKTRAGCVISQAGNPLGGYWPQPSMYLQKDKAVPDTRRRQSQRFRHFWHRHWHQCPTSVAYCLTHVPTCITLTVYTWYRHCT